MTSIAVVATCYDNLLGKVVPVTFSEIRWTPEHDYFKRLGDAAYGYEPVLNCLNGAYRMPFDRVFIAIEEPWYFGATKKAQSAWLKQQAEIAGAFKGALVRFGLVNIFEINNSQWKAVLRSEGVEIKPKDPQMKWKVKEWAIKAYGLPDLPDLVQSKSGAKIPRPESGFGAKAKAVQPSDVYDAAACCAYMENWILSNVEGASY